MRRQLLAAAMLAASQLPLPLYAQTIYPIDRADILAGAKFDFKVEFPERVDADKITITINGADYTRALGQPALHVAREDGKDQSALILRDVTLSKAGPHKVHVSDGVRSREITWNVYETGPRQAKNVILFIGDGMSLAHRVAARVLSKGMQEGKAFSKLAMDDMPQMALVSTSGADSIITDSANSASAYATGHKSSVNAMGVYADRTADPLDDPRVETITSLAQRRLGMAIGIVTNTEIEDATPAAMIAHTRRRAAYDEIVKQYFDRKPDVLLGGGAANFIPKGQAGSRRGDEADYVAKFREAGYTFVSNATELRAAGTDPKTVKLLGLFHPSNLDGVLDRKFLKGGSVKRYQDQPDLTDQVRAALDVLSRNPAGFFLMVESGLIDKYAHALDMERSVYDTIMLDNSVKIARDWARARGDDTLILVLADHTHPLSLIGTIDDQAAAAEAPMRERVRIYEQAKFPNYPAADSEGYPEKIDVSRRLAMFSASMPDHYETFRPKLDQPFAPTVAGEEKGTYKANERYKDVPGAIFRLGNLSRYANSSVHSAEDVILTAAGPGSEKVRGQLDNTEVFRVMVEALGLGAAQRTGALQAGQ